MDVKKLALLIGALVIAVITAVVAKNLFTGAGAQEASAAPVPLGPKVLVAKKALPLGTIVDADSFVYQPWPKELIQSAYYLEGQGADGHPDHPAAVKDGGGEVGGAGTVDAVGPGLGVAVETE